MKHMFATVVVVFAMAACATGSHKSVDWSLSVES